MDVFGFFWDNSYMNELIKRLETLKLEVTNLIIHLNLPGKEQRLLELEAQMQQQGFWNDNEHAQKVSKEHSQLKSFFDFWINLEKNIQENLD